MDIAFIDIMVSKKQKSILVIDDDPSWGRKLVTALVEAGYRARLSVSLEDSLSLLKRDSGFDLIFCDLASHGASGWKLSGAIRRENATVPIFTVAGVRDKVFIVNILKNGYGGLIEDHMC